MADEKIDISVVADLLSTLKVSLDDAMTKIVRGGAGSSSALTGRRALEDQNTGCQNSGCGGALGQEAAQKVGQS